MRQKTLLKSFVTGTICIALSICAGILQIGAKDMAKKDGNPGVGLTNNAANLLENSESTLVEPLSQFTAKLFNQLRQGKENVILSPISVHSALNLLLLGASSGSQTEAELLKVLGYSQNEGSAKNAHESYSNLLEIFKEITAIGLKAQQNSTNSPIHRFKGTEERPPVIDVWTMGIVKGDFKPKPDYLKQVSKYYYSSVKGVSDSNSAKKLSDEINKWAKEAGYKDGVIKQSDLEGDYSIQLLSAIRVQAFWFEEFYEYIEEETFYNNGLQSKLVKNSTVLGVSDISGKFVEFTHDKKSIHNYYNIQAKSKNPTLYDELANFEFRAIEIPLVGNLSFTIFEPLKNGTGNELAKLEDQLLTLDQKGTQPMFAKAFKLLDSQSSSQRFERLTMPPFKFESDIPLKPSLMSIGIKRAFERGNAELAKLSSQEQYVSDAKHQAVIEVNKQGIKAAGVTVIKVSLLALRIDQHPIRIHVKNPFMFVIRYSKVPLFIGHLVHY